MKDGCRCSICAVDWPHHTDYATCPECGEKTSGITNGNPLEPDEAKSRKNHADFERWLDEHNRRDPVENLERLLAA